MFPVVDRRYWNIKNTCCLRVAQPITDDEPNGVLFMYFKALQRFVESDRLDAKGLSDFLFMTRSLELSNFLQDLSFALRHIEATPE